MFPSGREPRRNREPAHRDGCEAALERLAATVEARHAVFELVPGELIGEQLAALLDHLIDMRLAVEEFLVERQKRAKAGL